MNYRQQRFVSALFAVMTSTAAANASPCYTTSLNFISQEEFFWNTEFGRIGVMRHDNKVGELIRYTCYDLGPFRNAGSIKIVVNPFVKDDVLGVFIEKPNYIGLQVVTIQPSQLSRSEIEFRRNKNSASHSGLWAVPKGAWRSTEDTQNATTRQEIDLAGNETPFGHSPDIPESNSALGESPLRRIPNVVSKFQAANDPESFAALAGRWHAWIVTPANEQPQSDKYYVLADTWTDASEWKLNSTELDNLVGGNRVKIRNYLHLITPMRPPEDDQGRQLLLRDSASKLRKRQIAFDVPIADAACLYIRPISSKDIRGRIPIANVGGERFVAFKRISGFNCPGPNEYRNLLSYLFFDKFLGYR